MANSAVHVLTLGLLSVSTLNIEADLDAALQASGISPNERPAAGEVLRSHIDEARRAAETAADPAGKARLLLAALHAPSGPLVAYDERATTFREVLATGRFNCVSASVLYLLAGTALGLEVEGELLPTHARARVRTEPSSSAGWKIVETTSPRGFDPADSEHSAITARVLPVGLRARSLASGSGARVGFGELLGAMLANRATLALEKGDLVTAEALLGAAEKKMEGAQMKAILRDQRASTLIRIAFEDMEGGTLAGLERAQEALLAGRRLDPQDPDVARATEGNLRAVTERLVREHIRAGQLDRAASARARAASLLSRSSRAGLRAFELSERARFLAGQGRWELALADIELALREPLGREDEKLREGLEANRASAILGAANVAAEAGALERALGYLDRSAGMRSPLRGSALDRERLRVARVVGHRRLEQGNLPGAADAFRAALTYDREDAEARQDLIATLQRLALPLVEEGHCREAARLLDEIERWSSASTFPREAGFSCALAAAARYASSDPGLAVALIEEARSKWPEDARWRAPLEGALRRWLAALVGGRRCMEAREVARRLAALGASRHSLGSCRP